ncbi:MAG: MFS transporter [Leptospiraceae bacterium]|nr:MFS transporter [Leptospiraceae bacterium]
MAYAIGQFGWSTLINIVGIQLLYFYIPPNDAGIPFFITQQTFLVVLNAIVLLAAAGRLWDAVTDPLIASLSDRWKGKGGRRIPFLKAGAAPAALFCVLLFVPINSGVSSLNIVWLFIIQTFFYLFITVYVTPFFALLPELGHSPEEKLNLSTWISITYALGIMLASQVPTIGGLLQSSLGLPDKVTGIQYSISILSFIAMLLMLVPGFMIDEKKYCHSVPSDVPLMQALKITFKNKSFIYYVVADFSYFMSLSIVMTGLLYYITVLLGLNASMMGALLPIMVVLSFLFYPLVNVLAKKLGKKILINGSFLFMALIFSSIYFFGKISFLSNEWQAYTFTILYSIPISFLGILPNAVLADIAEHDALKNGVRQEGMFFAARTLMQKFGQTFGVLVFAALTTFGKDKGDDLGVRISGIIGFLLCLFAGLYFFKYQEKELLEETISLQSSQGKE